MTFLQLLLICDVIFLFNGVNLLPQENLEIRENIINMFDAISQKNLERVNEYRTKLKNKADGESQAFLAMKNDLQQYREDKRNRVIEVFYSKERNKVARSLTKNDIFRAVSNEDLAEVKLFVEIRNISVNCTNYDHQTPAHTAAYKGNLTILEYLVSVDDSVLEIVDDLGQTVLHVATEKGPLEMIKFLVDDHKMDVYRPNKILSGNTVLHLAAFRGSLELVKYFIDDKKMDPNILNALGQPPIFHAAQNAHLNIVEYLYENHSANVQISDKENKTILHMCALRADLEIPKYLLDQKKLTLDINQQDSLGYTVVFWGSRRKRMDFLQYFIEKKHADVNIQSKDGQTALHQAVSVHNTELIEYLYKHGANVNLKDKDDYTPRNITEDIEIQDVFNKLIQPK